jgi:hypothetical protein
MLALWTRVTILRPAARACSKAKRRMRSQPKRVMMEMASAALRPGSM